MGLFYFAGHGVQFAWRNYLIPVDAVLETLDDVRTLGVELNTVLQSLRKAKNAMNVIILDACRDNPFGARVPIEQRGLSQFDAPPGSLLAYATAPGNVASDGEGDNGLYTENLLRELSVPETKIEDVFKRVRASARRRSNGRDVLCVRSGIQWVGDRPKYQYEPAKQTLARTGSGPPADRDGTHAKVALRPNLGLGARGIGVVPAGLIGSTWPGIPAPRLARHLRRG